MRISDLLPSGKERQAPFSPFANRLPSVETPAPFEHPAPEPIFSTPPAAPAVPNFRVPEPSLYKNEVAEPEWGAAESYGRLIQASRSLLNGLSEEKPQMPDLEALCDAVEQVLSLLIWQKSKILEFVERSTPEDYLVAHNANVTILALATSQHLEWPLAKQRALGVGCLLHDAGLLFHRELCSKARELTQEERLDLQRYVLQGHQLLLPFLDGLSDEARSVIENILLECRERNAGQGFPNRLTQERISPEARLVGLCDTYESFTHPRSWRARRLPAEALKGLLEFSGESFDGTLIKALRETLTLYPPGSFVKLTTGEIAKVVDLNRRLPTRPVLQVVVNADGTAARREKRIDLSAHQDVSIEKPVDECQLRLEDAGLLLELRARRWWLG